VSLYGHVLYIGTTRVPTTSRIEKTEAGRSIQEVYIGRQVQDMSRHKAHLEQCLQTFYVIMIQVYVICVVINAR